MISAWDGDRLVGLVRTLNDGAMLAYMHYVLVDPAYQGRGIAGHMVEMVKEKYRDYLYVEVMPEESKNAMFYHKHGFTLMADGVAMQTVNPDWRRDRYRHQQGYALIQHNNVVGGTAHRVTLQPHSSIFSQPSGTASASGACS